MARVLIPTHVADVHAKAVKYGLEQRGHEAVLWYESDLPSRQVASIRIDEDSGGEPTAPGVDLALEGHFDVVWLRRPTRPVLPGDMHPGDRIIARNEWEHFQRSLWLMVAPDAFWVNPLAGAQRASFKPYQLREAARMGFRVPPTLCSNDPDAIRAFLRRYADGAINKPFTPPQWRLTDGVASLFTSAISEDMLPDDEVLRLTPGIFQPRLEKAYELRVTFMGSHAFVVKLLSQEVPEGRIDWRAATWKIRAVVAELPDDVSRRCRALMDRLGIVFGCFDFIVTPAGAHYFIEVNQMGQFLWLEELLPELGLLDAFVELLIQRDPEYRYSGNRSGIRFRDLMRDESFEAYGRSLDRAQVEQVPSFVVDDE